ncbi:Isoflavipucine cluster transcription factor [Cladobotryum mycophilum]|uniref:Isoflavipucine cluster transcription factor n=1 Tax=Cladobotryum mycophilum TaxID=491253 RepID=A0ABR0SJJ5_9HYPO
MAKPTQRYACDRCHGQKLRCIRTDTGKCLRCSKAKATCVWSQSLRCRKTASAQKKQQTEGLEASIIGLPTNATLASSSTDQSPNSTYCHLMDQLQPSNMPPVEINLDMLQPGGMPPGIQPSPQSQDFSDVQSRPQHSSGPSSDTVTGSPVWMWSAATTNCPTASESHSHAQAGWQQMFNQEWAMLSSQHLAASKDMSPAAVSDLAEDGSNPQCRIVTIRQLSDLNVELYAHAATVPKPPMSLSEPLNWKDKNFAIDRTFQLSQRLIEILNRQYPRYLETASMSGSEPVSSDALQVADIETDDGSCLLILSCYIRLVGIYDNIFGNMQACLDRSSVIAREDHAKLPDVKFGSFSLPNSSALQIVLILQLARNLLNRMGEIVKAAGFNAQKSQSNPENPNTTESIEGPTNCLLPSAVKTVIYQENRLMTRITELRNTLIAMNIL